MSTSNTSNTMQNNIVVFRGDDFGMRLVFSTTDGVPVDITGWTIFLTIKANKDLPDIAAVISKTITTLTDPVNGIAEITVSHTETDRLAGVYFYDFQYKNTGGSIQTITSGGITFEKDITRRIV